MSGQLKAKKLADWYRASSVRYLGPVRFRALVERMSGDVMRIFQMSDVALAGLKGIVTPQVLEGIRTVKNSADESLDFAERQIALAEKCGGRILLLDDPDYPAFLKNSKMCHAIIFCRGNVRRFLKYDRGVAIVGTRDATPQSLQVARNVARELAAKGWVIVSGMAKGIDAAAHEGALEADGATIAVLGSGPDKPYPPECRDLYDRILKANAIFSEYPFGLRPNSLMLKKRNKTTVAFSLGAFVVQSTKTGGAMNAVTACQDQNKPVATLRSEGDAFSGNAAIAADGGLVVGPDDAAKAIEQLLLSTHSQR